METSARNPVVVIKSAETPYLIQRPQGYFEYQLPVSVKGIVLLKEAVLLVGNVRGELELPGGKLEPGETPEDCVRREIEEETGLRVNVLRPIHAWVYEITPSRHTFVLVFGVELLENSPHVTILASPEVGHAGWTPLSSLGEINMPEDYRVAIRAWRCLRQAPPGETSGE